MENRKPDMGVYPPGTGTALVPRLAYIIQYFDAGHDGYGHEYAATLREAAESLASPPPVAEGEAQPVAITDAMVAAAEAAVYKRHERGFLMKPLIDPIDMRAALTAALSSVPGKGDNTRLIEEYRNLVKTGLEYAKGELKLAPTSVFEIYMGHFRDIGRDIETALAASPKPSDPSSPEGAGR